jgi:hypothetical protein
MKQSCKGRRLKTCENIYVVVCVSIQVVPTKAQEKSAYKQGTFESSGTSV